MSEALDSIAPSFRAAKNRWPDAPNLQAHYADLSQTFESNGSSLLELCKSFVETVCITVINELGGVFPANSSPSTTELLGSALDALGLRSERGASALGTVISGHNKLAKGLSDARNNEGSVAHGKDGFLDAMADRHMRVYLLSADTILSLVVSAYENVEPSILHTRESHNRYQHHNKRIDNATAIYAEASNDGLFVLSVLAGTEEAGEKVELRVPASELLYCLDRKAYIDILNALRDVALDNEDEPEEDESEPVPVDGEPQAEYADTETETETETLIVSETAATPLTPGAELLQERTEYQGLYADKTHALYDFIIHSLFDGDSVQATQIQNFTYTLLNGMESLGVVDWSRRDSTRSAVRLFVKKLVYLFGIDGLGQESIDAMVIWLAEQIDEKSV